MPRESTIQVYRSSVTDIATGLTFGELAYTDVNGKLFVGRTGGAALWVGAGITTGDITNNSSVLVPTQSAVKAYVDGTIGGGSVVNTVNGTGGAITITGDGGSLLVTTSGKTITFSNRLASASVTGVASFGNEFVVSAAGAVSLTANYVRSFNGSTGAVSFAVPVASATVTGAASFSNTFFVVSGAGAVTLATPYTVTGDTTVAGTGITISKSGVAATINNNGVISVNGLTGALAITGDGASQLVSISGLTATFSNRLASTSVTGVASFDSTYFAVGTTGNVSFTAPFQVTGDTVSAGTAITATRTGRNVVITNNGVQSLQINQGSGIQASTVSGTTGAITYTITNTGVTSVNTFSGAVNVQGSTYVGVVSNANNITINNTGVQTFNGATGTITLTGAGAILYTQSGTTNTINARLAGSGVTGVASFNSASFAVDSAGDVTVKSAGISNAQLANSSVTVAAGGNTTLSLGGTITLTGGATPNILFSSSGNVVTASLANDVTIAGNLTVNGTVTTINVNDFIVEDPLIALGTGNAADSVDLGWYGHYVSGSLRYAGSFRDASDSGKIKFFTGLTAQPTTTIDTAAATYVTATIVANIDGGTF